MLIDKMVYLRDFIAYNFLTKIIAIESENRLLKNEYLLKVVNLLPYFVTNKIFKLTSFNYLYKVDEIIYYSNDFLTSISPLLLKVTLNETCIKENLDKYDNYVPLNLLFENENFILKDDDIIKIKTMSMGTVYENTFEYKKIKFNLKIHLLSQLKYNE